MVLGVHLLHLCDIQSIAMDNDVLSMATCRQSTVVISCRRSETYSPDIAIIEVSDHELTMTAASEATSFVSSLASVSAPISTRIRCGTTRFIMPNQSELMPHSVSSCIPRDYEMNNETINEVRCFGAKRPTIMSQSSTGQLFGFPEVQLPTSFIAMPCSVNILHPDSSNVCRNILMNSDKPSQLSGVNGSAQYAAANESHYAMALMASYVACRTWKKKFRATILLDITNRSHGFHDHCQSIHPAEMIIGSAVFGDSFLRRCAPNRERSCPESGELDGPPARARS